MKYYLLNPEVAGEIGEQSNIVYEAGRLKEVNFLEYVFRGWQGDELLTTHPCFIVSENLAKDIRDEKLSGIKFTNVKISVSEEFLDLFGKMTLPNFVRIICANAYEESLDILFEDFYVNKYGELIVSEKTLFILKKHKINNCIIEELV